MKEIKQEKIDFLQKEGYELLDTYEKQIGNYKRRYIKIKHLKCGKIYECKYDHFFSRGQRCMCERKLNSSTYPTEASYQKALDDKFGKDVYKVVSTFLGATKPIKLKHQCGYEYEISEAYFIVSNHHCGGRCPICTNGTSNTKERLEGKLKRHNANLTLLEPFEKGKILYLVKNNDCGHEYNIRTYDVLKENHLLNGYACPKCTNAQTSESEQIIKKFIESLGFDVTKKIIINKDVKFKLTNYEADMYIESKKIAFEFDGLYWHSEKRKADPNYHIDKTNFFKSKGIRLVHIFEDEFLEHWDIVKDKIKAILGVTENKIYARKCYIKEINTSVRNEFLEVNHIQGSDSANISLGLYYENELVATMSFCKLRASLGSKNKEKTYELSRFAGKLGYSIVGGFSKLLKYALNNYDIEEIKTYADLRWTNSDKNVYLTNGFKQIDISRPNYWYMKNYAKRLYRYSFRKSELKKKFPNIYADNKTEKEIMKEAGYVRIYDCGNLVYTYKKGE